MKYNLKIIDRPHNGVRVLNIEGDAELGNWHIADFAWREHAQFFIDSWNLHKETRDKAKLKSKE